MPKINSLFTMLAYHYAFGHEDEWVENLAWINEKANLVD
jgi:hypothetical protein